MRATKAAREAATKKRTEKYYRAFLGNSPDTNEPLFIRMFVIPNHWKIDAPRWLACEKRHVVVRSRAHLAKSFREWRAGGGRPKKGQRSFDALIVHLLREAMDKYERRNGVAA